MGVAAVIGTVTITASFQAFFEQQFSGTFRPDAFSIAVGQIRTGAGPEAGFFTPLLPIFTDRDLSYIQNVNTVKTVIPFGAMPLVPGQGVKIGESSLVTLRGVSGMATIPDAFRYGLIKLDKGRAVNGSSEVVVGHDVGLAIAKHFNSSDTSNSIGKRIRLNFANGNGGDFTVVGVLEQVPFSQVNSQLYVDLKTYYNQTRTLPGSNQKVIVYDLVTISAKSIDDVKVTEDTVLNYLKTSSDAVKFLNQDAPDLSFLILSQKQIISFIETQISQFGSFIGSIGFISLLVGAIGIANIMMVSVTERTREIGVMKATGARKSDILQLFLLEASIISAIGAMIGAVSGIALGYIFTQSGLFGSFNLPLTIRLEWFPISVGVGVLVGVMSGIYPAWRAARVNPVDALRYE
jgi:putative ABC transport system permease protein